MIRCSVSFQTPGSGGSKVKLLLSPEGIPWKGVCGWILKNFESTPEAGKGFFKSFFLTENMFPGKEANLSEVLES